MARCPAASVRSLLPTSYFLLPILTSWDGPLPRCVCVLQVRGDCLRLLGKLAEAFPVLVSDDPVYEDGMLYRACVSALSKPGVGLPEATGGLEGLDGLLAEARGSFTTAAASSSSAASSSPPAASSVTAQHLREVFGLAAARLDLTSSTGDDMKRFGAPRAAVRLLGRNLTLFAAAPGTPFAVEADAEAAAAARGGAGQGVSDDERALRRLGKSLLLRDGAALWARLLPLWQHRNADLSSAAGDVLRSVASAIGAQVAEVSRAAVAGESAWIYAEGRAALERARQLHAFISEEVAKLVGEAEQGAARGVPDAIDQMGLAVWLQGSLV